MGKNYREPRQVQEELGQHIYGLGELDYNFEKYEPNRERVLKKIDELSLELQTSQRLFNEEALKKSKATLSNGALHAKDNPQEELSKPEEHQPEPALQ